MPQKKQERVAAPGDDTQAYTLEMRKRLRTLKLQQEKGADEARSVRETQVDDYILKEADNAKISGLYAMWFVDKERDKIKAEAENPDKKVLRRRYDEAVRRLDGVDAEAQEEHKESEREAPRKGFLELTNVQDIDDLMEAARASQSLREPQLEVAPAASPLKARGAAHAARQQSKELADDGAEDEGEGIAAYLESLQRNSLSKDRASKRVTKKSPAERKRDYEDTKTRIFAATAAVGGLGVAGGYVQYGVDVAFSFGLGSVGALLYLSGISSYADNADNPYGQALGSRRLLVPVLLVLIATGWDRIEAAVPAVANLGLQAELLPVLLGFFTYTAGKVIGGLIGEAVKR